MLAPSKDLAFEICSNASVPLDKSALDKSASSKKASVNFAKLNFAFSILDPLRPVGKIMSQTINQIRAKPDIRIPNQRKVIQALFPLFLGALLGFLAKYFDNVPYLGAIGTSLGVWILIATLLAALSRSPKAAALHAFNFFAAMLTVYYLYSMLLFRFFPQYYFFAWGGIALLSPLGAIIVWYARGAGWMAAFCASLPIGLLLAEGYKFFYIGSIPQGFDVLAAIVLTGILGNTGSQRVRILLSAGLVFLIFWKLHILSLLFGGL